MFYELAVNTWDDAEKAAIQRVVDSDRFTMGPEVAAFEQAFADYLGRPYCVMVNSGSSANLISVAALACHPDKPLRPGDEVIVPAIAWATTYHPLHQYGLRMKVLDVELETLNADVSKLEQALTEKTRAVMAVSILGNPAALDVMRAFCDRRGLWLIEDNCESLDAELDGRKAGAFGHFSTHSTFFSHHISTVEGGLIVTDDARLYHLARSLRAHGWTRDLPEDTDLYARGADDFHEAYRFILPGYNLRPTEFAGAIGLEQLGKLPGMTARRRRNLAVFQELFAGDERFVIQREHGKSSCFAFTIILNPRLNLDRARALAALKEANIGFRMITGGNIMRHDVVERYDIAAVGNGTPNADIAHDRGFFVGNHPTDLRPQLEKLHGVLDAVCG